ETKHVEACHILPKSKTDILSEKYSVKNGLLLDPTFHSL
ncbi:MAG: hypothetical protein DRP42_05380, partial [Tenericutes bacterium]